MMQNKCQVKLNTQYSLRNRGAFLLELLIVIALLGIILGVSAQAVYVSMHSGKVSGERDVAMGLASEALEAVRGVTDEKWHNIFNLTKSTQAYYATITDSRWTIATGTATTTLNNSLYTTSIIINNVSRDESTRLIDTGANYDPSTQKVTVTVSWTGGDPVAISDYFFRWKNKVTNQTSWTGTGEESIDPPASIITGATLRL